jgi:molybdopterin molybdotransferase
VAEQNGVAEQPGAPIPLDDALAIVDRVVQAVGGDETLETGQALGRCLAAPVIAPRALPPFDNTAVDGYAFRYPTGIEAEPGTETEIWMAVQGESAAGIPFSGNMWPGSAIRISTGAVLPEGADTVVMQEDCRLADGGVWIKPIPAKGANVRYAGGDIRVGEVAFPAGQILRPQDVALLQALGVGSVSVKRRLRVAVASTGTELLEAGSTLGAGQIIDTNSTMLAQLLGNFPVEVTRLLPLPDDRDLTIRALAEAAGQYDLIVTTGGVSVGDHDHVRPALLANGQVDFWRLALRPGKPVLFGRIGKACMLGLPGNPVSAMVTLLIVGIPVIRKLLGMPLAPLPGFTVQLAEASTKSPRLREFPRVRLEWRDGKQQAVPYRDQSSNLLTSLAWADGILDLPVGPSSVGAGEDVTYRPFSTLLS